MSKITHSLISLLVLVAFAGVSVWGAEVKCMGTTPGGVPWDFSGLKADKDFVFQGAQNGYTYNFHINFCKDTTTQCASATPAAQYDTSDAHCVAYLGQVNQMSVDTIGNGSSSEGFAITYAGGQENRISVIKLICDEQHEGKLEFLGETGGAVGGITYTFAWRTKWGCPIGECGSFCLFVLLSEILFLIFDIMFIGVIIAIPVILVIIIIINKFILHKSGADIVPLFRFWKNLPMVLFDGMKFPIVSLVACIKALSQKDKYAQMK